ncbi:MAG: hypothetical protein RMJ98_13430 [Myxococcales bacterium]|nr:hypothetical protein [Polyangiaceae bacterium]MDW8250291.1 hypothetical protein [Myxococcales bacterium]
MSGKKWVWSQVAYLGWASLMTLASARVFYGYMLQQTGGEWSAPLDDVFIHFNYARATARGYPFQWTEGNGYSSGGTSLLYPLVLALGYWAGFRGPELMVWAAVVACVSVLGFLWAGTLLFHRLPPGASVLLPPAIFSVGALCWSLWSGMEVAFFLGIWAIALVAWFTTVEDEAPPLGRRSSWLGLVGVLVVLARPEGATSVAVLGCSAALLVGLRRGLWEGLKILILAGFPAAGALMVQALVNWWLTGESSANGALVKLALYNPYMTPEEKWADYQFNLRYIFDRLSYHHFGEERPWGLIPLVLGLGALLDQRTRRPAALLLASAATWWLVVATNGQVRWQNERYTMPLVAWLLAAAALGLGALVLPSKGGWAGWARAGLGALLASFLVLQFWKAERIQYRDQIWFFGRASRNIRDQHTTAGRLIRKLTPAPKRLMVGDAGALIYASDLPGFDLIGLGGYRDLPLARAGVHGLPATLELLERIPSDERPDYMAIYPTWWPPLPHWFGRQVFSVPVRGNVICGGAEKVIYRTDWRLLGTGQRPRSQRPGEELLDELDVADLVSEKQHEYRFPRPQGGWTDMRVLPDPEAHERDLWDAGRRIPNGRAETFRLRGLRPSRPLRLAFRTVVERPSRIEITAGTRIRQIELSPAPGWTEVSLEIDPEEVKEDLSVSLTPKEGEWVNYHIWALGRR